MNTIFPKTKNENQGWILSYSFLLGIKEELKIYEDCPDLEGIENVLLSKIVSNEIQKLQKENDELKLSLEKAEKEIISRSDNFNRVKKENDRLLLNELLKQTDSDESKG
jgi:hypothetical protein